MMRTLMLGLVVLLGPHAAPAVADQLADARRLYNQAQYVDAQRLAKEATLNPAQADAARVVLGRVMLERFRQTADAADLAAAREAFVQVNPAQLSGQDRVDLMLGQAEALYLEQRWGAAAELYEAALDRASALGPAARERTLDWWATALDRYAHTLPADDRGPVYERIAERMATEITMDSGSIAAGYWLPAAVRAAGDPDRAWQLALAGWVRATLSRDRGAALRGDLDRLVTEAVIPECAARRATPTFEAAEADMRAEWEKFKGAWSK